jgi:hypothetical protein
MAGTMTRDADAPLGASVIENAAVYPTFLHPDHPNRSMQGVFDASGSIIPSSFLDRAAGNNLGIAADPACYPPLRPSPHDEAIFGGVFYDHYGHFLIECLARFWYAAAHPDLPVLFLLDPGAPVAELRPWAQEILDLLDLRNPIDFVADPIRVPLLHLPDIGYRYAHWFHPDHARFLGRYQGPPQEPDHRLWLSRRGDRNGFHLVNSEIVERRLAAAGWHVIAPETMTVREQLDAFSRATHIAGEEGSAFHTVVLMADVRGKRFDIIKRYGAEHPSFHTIGNAIGMTQTFHGMRMATVLAAKGRGVSKMLYSAAEIMNALSVPVTPAAPPPPDHAARRAGMLISRLGLQSVLETGAGDGCTILNLKAGVRHAVDPVFPFDARAFRDRGLQFFEVEPDHFFVHFVRQHRYDLIILRDDRAFMPRFRQFCASLSVSHDETVWLIDQSPDPARADDSFRFLLALQEFFPTLSWRTITTGEATGRDPQIVLWKEPRKGFAPRLEDIRMLAGASPAGDDDGLSAPGSEDEVLADVITRLTPRVAARKAAAAVPATPPVQATPPDRAQNQAARQARRKARRLRAEGSGP